VRGPDALWRAVAVLVGAAIVWLTATRGIWEAPLVLAALWALAVPGARAQFGGAIAIAVLGDGAALARIALVAPLARTAGEVAEIMGFGHAGVIVWALTGVLALAEAAVGAWVGRSVLALLRPDGSAAARRA
jgi:hypothetical protein